MERKKAAKLKITVLKTLCFDDLVDQYVAPERRESYRGCQRHREGQEFVIDSFDKPEGFCSWAWADIHREIVALMFNADFPKSVEPGVTIASCTDGIRPVIFKVERLAQNA